jgi:hypothetical protein
VNELLAAPEANLLSMPTVLTRNGTLCNIHSAQQVEVPDGTGGVLGDFSGWKIDLAPELQGEGLVANGTADVGALKGNGTVQHGLLDIAATMNEGEVALLRLPEGDPGKQMIGLFSFAAVHASDIPSADPVHNAGTGETETAHPADPFEK